MQSGRTARGRPRAVTACQISVSNYWSAVLSWPNRPPKEICGGGALGAVSLGSAGTTEGFFADTFVLFLVFALVFFATFLAPFFLRAGAARLPRFAFFAFAFLRFFAMFALHSDQQASRFQAAEALRRMSSASGSGVGPPVAQSSNSTVCTIGTSVPVASCVMQPILPAAIKSGLSLLIFASLRARNCPESAGCMMLYVPAEPQHK